MRYAISYVSTADTKLSSHEVEDLLNKIELDNNSNDITGILLSSDTNFFQLLEGEEKVIKELYSHIIHDTRHNNIIKFIDKPVTLNAYDGYLSRMITDKTKHNGKNLKNYLHYIEVLDKESRKAVKRVIEAIII